MRTASKGKQQWLLDHDKVSFQAKNFTGLKESFLIMIKGSAPSEDVTVLNVCASKKSSEIHKAKNDKAERRSRHTDNYASIPLSVTDRTGRPHKISKDKES